MEIKDYNTKGLTFYLVFGSYGGFHIKLTKSSFGICLGWVAFRVIKYDVENLIQNSNQNTRILLAENKKLKDELYYDWLDRQDAQDK